MAHHLHFDIFKGEIRLGFVGDGADVEERTHEGWGRGLQAAESIRGGLGIRAGRSFLSPRTHQTYITLIPRGPLELLFQVDRREIWQRRFRGPRRDAQRHGDNSKPSGLPIF